MYVLPEFLSVLLLICIPCFFAGQALATTGSGFSGSNSIEILQKRLATVVTVKARTYAFSNGRATVMESSGAGVIIDPDGTLVTNTHVIYGSQTIQVGLRDGTWLNAKVIYVSPESDFSLLTIQPNDPLPFAHPLTRPVSLGESVTTIGHSALLNETISGGIITGEGTTTTAEGTHLALLRLNINHYQGDSGGPVFTPDGYLVGLISSKQLNTDRHLLVVPVSQIFEALHRIRSQNK